ncbi:MAG: DUF2807 domain-containing protein [Bacteroidales bacterium]|jgi:hypothetical protein|nr:DUF2807 domain-containing protein [Bacteroidales bacterium]
MKTKIILLAALFIGFSISSFSQEEITIKQVIKNSSKSTNKKENDEVNIVRVYTSIPITINQGTENAIYLTGEFSNSEDYAGFCILEDGTLKINSPKKGKKIILELSNDVNLFYFGNNANVMFNKDIDVQSNGIFGIENNSLAMINSKITGKDLMIRSRNNSHISFNSIDVDKLDVKIEKGSEVILNGKTNKIKLDKDENSKFIKDTFKYSSLFEAVELYEGDTNLASGRKIYVNSQEYIGRPKRKDNTFLIDNEGNIINSKGDTISIADTNSDKKRYETSISWNPNKADLIIGKNANVRIIFSDNIKEGYISNYPIKGYDKNKLIIQDDYPVDLVLTIKKDVGNITLKEGAKVIIDSEIKGKYRSYYLFNNSELIFNNKVEVSELEVSLNNAAKASFKNLKADKLILQGNGTSELEINGEIEILDRYKYDDVNFKGDYKINTTKERKIKELGISTPIPLNINNRNKSGDENSEKIKAQNIGKDKVSIDLTFGYGVLNWSNGVNKIDDLFSSPNNEYKLRMGDSWNFGLKFRYNINSKLRLYTGIGIESNVFKFENNVKITETNGDIRLAYETDPLIFNSKSNICARYFTIPIHIQYFFYKKFSIHAGGIFGINYRNSSTGFERKYDIPNAKITEEWGKNYDNFKPLKFDVKAGIGWSSFNFYVKYSLTPIFKDNKEMVLYPYSIGFSLGI